MVEVFVGLGIGGLLAYVLSGPSVPRAKNPAKSTKATKATKAPAARSSRPAPPAAPRPALAAAAPAEQPSPRKSTQTVRKFK
ncbi:MAG: hypothetical protein AB7F65_05545 [Dehalococcoidia bacterium]